MPAWRADEVMRWSDKKGPRPASVADRGPFRYGLVISALSVCLMAGLATHHAHEEQHDFFTLNNIGTAYCGYRVQAREPFIRGIEAQGYRLRDQWRNLGKRMPVIGQPEYSVEHYSGFCFDRVEG